METDEQILIFDVETTGTNPERDQVVELSIQFGLDANSKQRTLRFKPTVPISPEAEAVHGISMEDLKDCPAFSAKAEKIAQVFNQATTLIGYNVNFDLRMIQSEFQRARVQEIDLTNKHIVDPYRLWQEIEPRKLENAYERFVGGKFQDAHSAAADVQATGKVLEGMLRAFGIKSKSMDELCHICNPDRQSWIGPSNHIQWKVDQVVISFGKHSGEAVVKVAKADASYLRWILSKDFPPHVGEIMRQALSLDEAEFGGFIRSNYHNEKQSAVETSENRK